MKWNIFERLSKLESELKELRGVVLHQANTIIYLQAQKTEEPKQLATEVKEEAPNGPSKNALYKRLWYAKNKEKIAAQRKARKAAEKGQHKKAYYWKNKERLQEYNRQHYLKKKAVKEAQATTQENK